MIDATSTGKYSLSLRLFDSAHSSSLDIPYSPGNIFTKRGGSQLADSKERFDGCVWKVKCRFSQIESGWETIVRSLEWRRRIQPSCCFEPFPHACTFVISAFPLLERLTGHRARKRYFVCSVQIFQNRNHSKSSDLFKWMRCVFFSHDYGNREWKGKRRKRQLFEKLINW